MFFITHFFINALSMKGAFKTAGAFCELETPVPTRAHVSKNKVKLEHFADISLVFSTGADCPARRTVTPV